MNVWDFLHSLSLNEYQPLKCLIFLPLKKENRKVNYNLFFTIHNISKLAKKSI